MIVIGYQGIGKSTIAGKNGYIDLESGNFWVDGKRDHEWYKPYCQIAVHLHRQGYIVFTSSHEVVRNYLKEIETKEDWDATFVCHPDPDLKDAWIYKLQDRYEHTGLEKDFKAWKNAEERFEENIRELETSGFKRIPLETMQYDLEAEIAHAKKWRCK
jgi:hypothetical protein